MNNNKLIVVIMGIESFINSNNNYYIMGKYKWGDRTIIVLCPCGKEFKCFTSSKKKYCSLECSGKFKQKVSFWKGKEMPKEMKEKLSIAHKKMWAEGKMDNRKKLLGDLNHSKKPEVRLKISIANSKDKHWNWQGGITGKDYPQEWNRYLKNLIKERDNYTCQSCGRKDVKINVHHKDSNKKNSSLNNLITWCTSCHMKYHNGKRKK